MGASVKCVLHMINDSRVLMGVKVQSSVITMSDHINSGGVKQGHVIHMQ